MVAGMAFPRSLVFDGLTWHLLYNPTDATSGVPPDVSGVPFDARCDPVKIGGQDNPWFLVTIDFNFPARATSDGRLIPERKMRAFKLSPVSVVSMDGIVLAEFVCYLAEPSPATQGSRAQRFIDTILGVVAEEQAKQVQPDTSWCAVLTNAQKTVNNDKTTTTVTPEVLSDE